MSSYTVLGIMTNPEAQPHRYTHRHKETHKYAHSCKETRSHIGAQKTIQRNTETLRYIQPRINR